MSDDRPPIPRQMRRDVLIEAGFRCAVPNCRTETVEIHHIDDWARVREHTFDNLIALCPTCHARVTKGQIDTKAIRQIKANLSILNHRYGDLERRLLLEFARTGTRQMYIDHSQSLLVSYLVEDHLLWIEPEGSAHMGVSYDDGTVVEMGPRMTYLTDKGQEFIETWLDAKSLENVSD